MHLLSVKFPGVLELKSQVENALATPIDSNGSLRIYVTTIAKADVNKRIPVEAHCTDTDGVVINILLHVQNGVLSELEIYKDDLSSICSPLVLNSIETSVLPP